MSDAALHTALKELIVERLFLDRKGVKPGDIGDDADLMDNFEIDSVMMFEIVVGLEEDYGVAVPEEEFSIELYRSVDKLAALVGQYGSA